MGNKIINIVGHNQSIWHFSAVVRNAFQLLNSFPKVKVVYFQIGTQKAFSYPSSMESAVDFDLKVIT